MVVGHIDVLYEIFFAGGAALAAHAAARLGAVFGERGTLDVTQVGYGDDHVFVGVEIFGVDVVCGGSNLGAALVAVLVNELVHLVFDDGQLQLFVCKHIAQMVDQLLQVVVLCLELVALQTGELTETHG